MRELLIDTSKLATVDDLYSAFFDEVGAPAWHGRNFNALRDSIAVGSINEIELPYRIVLLQSDKVAASAQIFTAEFISLIRDIARAGHPVEIELR